MSDDKVARKAEIKKDIDAKNDAIVILKEMRRKLDVQMATFGLYVPPYITQQIADVTNQIAVREKERSKLETEAVEEELPLAEAEFQALVAEAWIRSAGWLSIVDKARLELSRLRLGIEESTADTHHDTVRKELATETLLDLELNDIQGAADTRGRAVQRIVRAFRFDPHVTEELLGLNIDPKSTKVFADWIDTTRTIWKSDKEYRDLKELFNRLLHAKPKDQDIATVMQTVPQVWEGQYTYGDTGRQTRMILSIEQVNQTRFSGKLEWPDQGNTITSMKGHIVEATTDGAEQHKWNQIHGFQRTNGSVQLIFTEPGFIQGHGIERQGVYYAIIQEGHGMRGVWFKTASGTTALGTFELRLHPLDRTV